MLDSFLTYISNMVKVLPPHQVLLDVTGGGLGSLSEMEHLLHHPLPAKAIQGQNPAGNPESLRRGMLNQPTATLERRGGYQSYP